MAGVCETYKSKKSWRIFWNVDGKQLFRKLAMLEFSTKKKAYQEAVRLESAGEMSSGLNMTINDFYNNVYLINRNINEGSRPSYKAMFQRFLPFIKMNDIQYVSEITEEVVIKYLNFCKNQIPKGRKVAYSPKTLNRDRDYLNLIFEMAKRKDFLKRWERKEIQKLSEKEHKRMPDYKNYPNKDERKTICKWVFKNEPYYFAWLHFDATYGWRRDEVRKLEWKEIDFDNRTMKLLRTKKDQRQVALTDEDISVLTEHILILKKMSKYDPKGYVFPNIVRKRKDTTPGIVCKNNLYKAIKRACAELGITKHISPHSFRHAVTSELKQSGRYSDVDIIQITGHRDTDSLKFYTHPNSDQFVKISRELSLGVMPRVRTNE